MEVRGTWKQMQNDLFNTAQHEAFYFIINPLKYEVCWVTKAQGHLARSNSPFGVWYPSRHLSMKSQDVV